MNKGRLYSLPLKSLLPMQKTRHLLLLLTCIGMSCTGNISTPAEQGQHAPIRRTIIAYICGDNDLNTSLQDDVSEMTAGSSSLPSDCRLVVFADYKAGINGANTPPYIAEISNGRKKMLREYAKDFHATSADSMRSIIQWIADRYPSEEYALIMSGHSKGPIIRDDTIATNMIRLYTFGYDDTGEEGTPVINGDEYSTGITWLNVPTIATVLSNLNRPDGGRLHFEYIFFDCCVMQTAEVAYELRHYTDCIIAPASETPQEAAPFQHIVPLLGVPKEQIGDAIITQYMENTDWGNTGGIVISAVKTSEMQHLMEATRTALRQIWLGKRLQLNLSRCIYYYRDMHETDNAPALHDIKNVMLNNLPHDTYEAWLTQFDRTVTACYIPTGDIPWHTENSINFYSFTVTDNTCGGMGMTVPNTRYDLSETRYPPITSVNKTMYTFQWANDIGWRELGW